MKRFVRLLWRHKIKIVIAFLLGCVLSLYLCNLMVIHAAKGKLYSNVSEVPHRKVGLVLGTSKILSNGRINLYYQYRLDAAIQLYKSGKISYVLVSGDNGSKEYDEPSTFKEDLIAAGIPAANIYLDYAGFRTLDSMVRAKEIFNVEECVIISQQFHNERAIYIAKHKGIDAIGFNATMVHKSYSVKTRIRERFARVKVGLDILLGIGPKFLGKKIPIGEVPPV